ncbi:MAG TPA: RNA polymerase sigma-54 factor, partial [Solibacterales bacterium]|nr:RNA polymerase sigma-54 factor [Bryobacterales bacterium]
MSLLSPRLQLKVAQKQILTPGLVQMVTVLQLNRLELKEMITQEIARNPVLEESGEGDELTPEEVQAVLEAERVADPSDKSVVEAMTADLEHAPEVADGVPMDFEAAEPEILSPASSSVESAEAPAPETVKESADPFDEIDFGSYFDDYLDPGYKSPSSESVDKPSFETFLSAPVTLADHLTSQLALLVLPEHVRDAAESVVGNLDENGFLIGTLEEIAAFCNHPLADAEAALKAVQSLDPAGIAARDIRECLLLQLTSRRAEGGLAWRIVSEHLRLVETKQWKELARLLKRPMEHIQIAVAVIRTLDPRPGLRYSGPGARVIEPDVY